MGYLHASKDGRMWLELVLYPLASFLGDLGFLVNLRFGCGRECVACGDAIFIIIIRRRTIEL